MTDNEISQKDKIIKYKFARKEEKKVKESLEYFLYIQGLSYILLN